MQKKFSKGFTLIELMIVVAIIGILAAIAIPNFIRYQLKSKQGEAKTVIGGIRTCSEAFRGEYDAYLTGPSNPGVAPAAAKRAWTTVPVCDPLCTRTNLGPCGAANAYVCMGYQPSGAVYFNYAIDAAAAAATGWSYTVSAESDLDEDTALSGWVYALDNDGDDAADVPPGTLQCGNAPIAGQLGVLHECDPQVY